MNKEERRRQQTIDILKDLRQGISDTREDYKFPNGGFPLELGIFYFNNYTTNELFTIAENLKSKNIVIKFQDWFLDGEPFESHVEAHHDSHRDVIIGYVECVSLGALKYKIDLEIGLMTGVNFTNSQKIDRVHFLEDLSNLIHKILEYEKIIKVIKLKNITMYNSVNKIHA